MPLTTWCDSIRKLIMMKIINFHRIKIIVLLITVVFFTSCHSKTGKKVQSDVKKGNPAFTLETFKSEAGWGYEIKVVGKTKIKQTFIPAIQGNLPFYTEMEARRVGELVLKKVKKKDLPTITKHELDSLQITY